MIDMNRLSHFILIAGRVGLDDYLQRPEDFEELILLLSMHSTSQMPAPNAVCAAEVKDGIAETQDFSDRDPSII
jgi:DNA-binding response OmpR family regulator